jgi:HPr kinase/phosphorylase
MSSDNADMVHATAVSIGGNGVMLTGSSGSGKSDLALRLIDRGAVLISDDIVVVDTVNGKPRLYAAPNIEGKIEARGVGILVVDFVNDVPLRLVVSLSGRIERLPNDNDRTPICGFGTPWCTVAGLEASAPLKVEHILRRIITTQMLPVPLEQADTA